MIDLVLYLTLVYFWIDFDNLLIFLFQLQVSDSGLSVSATVVPSVTSSVFSSEVLSVPPSVFSSHQLSPLPGPSDLSSCLRQILNISYIWNKNHNPSLHACFECYLQIQWAYATSDKTNGRVIDLPEHQPEFSLLNLLLATLHIPTTCRSSPQL